MKLHSKILGEGKPLLILHGFLGMSDNWKTLGNQFAEEGYEVHLIDQRNHGRSPHSDAFSYELMARDIVEYCETNQLEKINIIGHSMGGKTAMFLATTYPDLVQKLIVVDIAPKYYAPHHQKILEGLAFLNSQELTSRKTADAKLSTYVEEPSVRQFLLKNLYWKEKNKLGLRLNLKSLTQHIENISELLPKEKRFSGKTLFVKGEKSGYLLESDKENIQEHFPKAEFVSIKNAGHWVHAENRKGFFTEVMTFLIK